ncbi:glycerophosphodiester phosphodiesterase family protein, partial [Limosilactobacillus mucosae]|nr:glycerophosphodiester phosphodiesterase family protein [Limosilactobacillus mucosae]
MLIFSLLGWSINHFLLLILMELKKFPGKWVWGVAIAFRSLMLLAGFWLLAGAIVSLVLWQLPIKKAGELSTLSKTRWRQAVIWMTIGALVVLTSIMSLPMTWHRPLVISHRGVTQADGVQNTLPAARKTQRLHPDYIEIDVHETADQKFVVVHDENLHQLTGVNRKPHQLILKQLQNLVAKENGQQAQLVSLDQYLSFAQQQHQKLLVEIKTTP